VALTDADTVGDPLDVLDGEDAVVEQAVRTAKPAAAAAMDLRMVAPRSHRHGGSPRI
jgi:hypothetical protein